MNENNDIRQYLIDAPIPFSDRITSAIQSSFALFCQGLINLALSPVAFFRCLFTSTQKVIDLEALPEGHPVLGQFGLAEPTEPTIHHEHKMVSDDDDEDWRKEHRKQYGE